MFWSIDSVVYILIIDLVVGKWQVQVNVVVAVLRCCQLRLEEYQRFFKGLIVICIVGDYCDRSADNLNLGEFGES